MEPNRPELAVLRGKRDPEHLALWVEYFGEGDRALADRYALAIATFLGEPGAAGGEEWESYVGHLAPNTRRAYAYAVTEFFEWIATKYGRVVAPHRVLRKDAEDYVNWLSVRPYSLTREKLEDGDEPLRLAIFDAVSSIGGAADRRSIFALLSPGHRSFGIESITKQLGRMVLHDLLERRPTLEQLREEWPRAGIDQFSITFETPEGPKPMALEDVFQYTLPRPRGVSRTTIAVRLAALSAFWRVLAQGENVPGGEAILQHNIFEQVKKRVTRGIGVERKQAAAAQRMDPTLVPRLLAAANDARTLTEKRDKALFYFLVFTGTRVSEVIKLRRGQPLQSEQNRWPGWFVSNVEPPLVRVRRKGGKMMSLPYPPLAMAALADFQAELDRRAAPVGAQDSDPRVRGYIHPDSPRWRYRELSIMPDAPLFPPVSFWGANSTSNYQELKPNLPGTYGPPDYRRSLTRHGVTKLLRRLAQRAGLSDSEVPQVHPHAVRHFAATAMGRGGKDIREIQAIMGHESITTTEGYLAEIEGVVALSGQAEILQYLTELGGAPVPTPPPRPQREKVVETYAVPVPPRVAEEPPEAPPAAPARPPVPAATPGQPPTPQQELAAVEAVALPQHMSLEARAETPHPSTAPARAEQLPEHMIPVVPPAPPAIELPEVHAGAAAEVEPVVAVEGRDEEQKQVSTAEVTGESPAGDWDWVYDALRKGEHPEHMEFTALRKRTAATKDLVTIAPPDRTQMISGPTRDNPQGHRFLASYYDPWPEHYGIGTSSLLPWFTRGQPRADGRVRAQDPVTGKQIDIPVLPVLAPEQVYPETDQPSPLLDFIEQLYGEWLTGDPSRGIGPSPTRTYGLVRWWGFFAYTTANLEAFLAEKRKEDKRAHIPTWMPWDAVVPIGDLRAHDQRWLQEWFRENAHTYVTTQSQFHKVKRGRGEKASDEAFWKHFERTAAENVAFVDELPEWFADDDPIAALYAQDPKEWDAFAKWIANITGLKLTKARERARSEARVFAELDIEGKREVARDLLESYFENDEHMRAALFALKGGASSPRLGKLAEEYVGWPKEELRRTIEVLQKGLESIRENLSEIGIAEVESVEGEKVQRKKRIEQIVTAALPDPKLDNPNVFVRSELFDPGFFSLDFRRHTIVHTEEYRQLFRERFDGRDSELVMRRAARAMWEFAKRTKLKPEETKTYHGEVYAVMLAYIAWIVPAGAEMERQMVESGRVVVQGPEGRREWLRKQAATMKELKYGVPERTAGLTEEDRINAVIAAMNAKDIELSVEEAENALALYDAHQLHGAMVTKEDVEDALLREVRKRTLMAEGVEEKEADAALERFDIVEHPVTSDWSVDRFGEVAAELGEGGSMHVTRGARRRETKEEKLQRRQEEIEQHGPVIHVVRRGKKVPEGERVVMAPKGLKKNASFEALQGERVAAWYRVDLPPSRDGLTPNRGAAYVSAGALQSRHRMLANARSVMPSPFRMIVAMNLAAIDS